ncbi:MAG: response regulator [Phycisphaeraceae bacterium]|nr:response regulator [Phycisphaeraceae bacterium]
MKAGGREILIVDNDDGAVRAIELRLMDAGYRCAKASCGVQALSLYHPEHTALVITDLNMPSGSGIDLIRSIRQQHSTPMIVITGFADDFDRSLHQYPGITVLQKPFEAAALLDLVELELSTPPNESAA